jgi:hypothetical protein
MHLEPKWITSDWNTDDLNGRSVKYRLRVADGKSIIEGTGVFRAATRPDGLKSIEISIQGREPERVTQVRLSIDESQVRWLKKLPDGSPSEFSLEEPDT